MSEWGGLSPQAADLVTWRGHPCTDAHVKESGVCAPSPEPRDKATAVDSKTPAHLSPQWAGVGGGEIVQLTDLRLLIHRKKGRDYGWACMEGSGS